MGRTVAEKWADGVVQHAIASPKKLVSDALKKPDVMATHVWSQLADDDRMQLAVSYAVLTAIGDTEGDAAAWIKENVKRGSHHYLPVLLKSYPSLLHRAQAAYLNLMPHDDVAADDSRVQERFVQPNRHVTMLVYLNPVEEGGETVFPEAQATSSNSTAAPAIVRDGVAECSKGFAVPPLAFGAALFYHKHGNGSNDDRSRHAGCPTVRGEKWAINSFMWNVPMEEGLRNFQF